jgi:hypothetical protein
MLELSIILSSSPTFSTVSSRSDIDGTYLIINNIAAAHYPIPPKQGTKK